jgi:hypothetical protein
MKNQQHHDDLQERLAAADCVPSEPVPAGWSRRNWVQRDAIAFAAAALSLAQRDLASE